MRDTQTAFVQTQGNYLPVIDALRGITARIAKDDNYWEMLANGGGFATLYRGETTNVALACIEEGLLGLGRNHSGLFGEIQGLPVELQPVVERLPNRRISLTEVDHRRDFFGGERCLDSASSPFLRAPAGKVQIDVFQVVGDRVFTDTLDALAPIKKIAEQEARALGEAPDLIPYREMRLVAGLDGVIESVFKRGSLRLTETGDVAFRGKSFNQVFAPVAADSFVSPRRN